MGVISNIFGPFKKVRPNPLNWENPENPLTAGVIFARQGYKTPCFDATPHCGALRYTPVFACERLITETIASFPLITYKRLDGDGRGRAGDNPLYTLLHDRPNDFQTPFVFWDAVVKSAIRYGNAFVYIERNGAAQPANLILLDWHKVKVQTVDGQKVYQYDNTHTVSDEDMIHVLGFSDDGMVGVPLLRYAEKAIQLGLAAEEYGLKFFTQGATVGGVIELPDFPTPQQLDTLRTSFSQQHAGLDNAHKPAVVVGKYNVPQLSNDQAQFIELRKLQLLEIARIFRIPPHLIGDLDRGTFSNIEQQSLEFISITIRPWLKRIEQEINRKLFGTGEFFAEFMLDDLVKGDLQTRTVAYNTALQGGWMTVNEVRKLENLPPLPGGDVLRTPLNMAPAAKESQQEQGNGGESGTESEGNPQP